MYSFIGDPKGRNLTQAGPWLEEFIDLHLLGIRDHPIILCEGEDDRAFLSKLADLYEIDMTGFDIIPVSGKTTHISTVAASIKEKFPKQKIIAILDRDFSLNPEESKDFNGSTIQVYWWDLPAIESYLFVYNVARELKKGSDPLGFLRDPDMRNVFADIYVSGFRTQNPTKAREKQDFHTTVAKDASNEQEEAESLSHLSRLQKHIQKTRPKKHVQGTFEMIKRFYEAISVLELEQPALEDIRKVAQVIHGHTWVTDVLHATTPQLIADLENDFKDYFPSIPLLEQLESIVPRHSDGTALLKK